MDCDRQQYERPAFWRVPHTKTFELPYGRRRVHFNKQVQVNSPAQAELLRGDIITKIDQYDARDLTHNDAQNMFRSAGNQMRVTVRRDDKVALHQSAHPVNGNPVPPASYAQPYQPYVDATPTPAPAPVPAFQPSKPQPHQNFPPPDPAQLLPTISSPLPHGPQSYAAALEHPLETLPHTVFPGVDASGAYHLPKQPYPPPAPIGLNDASEAIANQPYRTTPLVLPGAKVPKKDTLPTESYLRHHPNPAMRAPPAHDYTDTLMKQKLAETVIHRVIGDEPPTGPKVVHKQFNSPIGLYSDSNIENTLRQSAPQQTQTVPSNGYTNRHRPTKIEGYKKTVVFDPCKSETYRALQEGGGGEGLQEVPNPIQQKTFHANRLVPGKKPNAYTPAPQPEFAYRVNSMGEPNEKIHQSGSFKRLMLHVMSEMD
ncbi:resuscitation-promoting factor RpfA isoform X2 [Anopheles cruzii]|uniref:resuscitation-promoting factor RpfA isoform X2 n=1 Tax=Anopheles cruzii TaxID=68878 RepID=UPI0022EC3DC2|nr:resuscitation-promoting factor RpfA isoform X2 [Anopheles cruzii]